MDIQLANLLEYYCNSENDMRVIDDYSGRGMFGKETAAITTGEYTTMGTILSALLQAVKDGDITADDLEHINVPNGFRLDSMGLGSVIY